MKVKCDYWRCGWVGDQGEVLRAQNPFDPEDEVTACPKCKDLSNNIIACCDEPGCDADGSCGTPTPKGYRHTCGKHRPAV